MARRKDQTRQLNRSAPGQPGRAVSYPRRREMMDDEERIQHAQRRVLRDTRYTRHHLNFSQITDESFPLVFGCCRGSCC